jgi:hypothetical protein
LLGLNQGSRILEGYLAALRPLLCGRPMEESLGFPMHDLLALA